jgi:hypothetical protein
MFFDTIDEAYKFIRRTLSDSGLCGYEMIIPERGRFETLRMRHYHCNDNNKDDDDNKDNEDDYFVW